MSDSSIAHGTAALYYYPPSSGLAEHAVQTFKSGLKRTLELFKVSGHVWTRHHMMCEKQQTKQAEHHDTSKPLKTFQIGYTVYGKNFSTASASWLPGKITMVTGPHSYHVKLELGHVCCHMDAIHRWDVHVLSLNKLLPPPLQMIITFLMYISTCGPTCGPPWTNNYFHSVYLTTTTTSCSISS